MKDQRNDRVEQMRRKGILIADLVFGPSQTALAIRRLNAIENTLESELSESVVIFTESRESGYKQVDERYKFVVDLADLKRRTWLTNLARGVDASLRTRDHDAISRYNQIIEMECKVIPKKEDYGAEL